MQTRSLAALLAVMMIAAGLFGCTDFTEGKDRAVVNEAEEPAETPTEEQPAEEPAPEADAAVTEEPVEEVATLTYALTPDSSIIFEGSKTIDTHVGGFEKFDGIITMQDGDPSTAKIDLTIDTQTIFSDDTLLTSVLKGKEWFAIEEFPESTFVSTKIEGTNGDVSITGNLTIKGVTKSITFPATVNIADEKITGDAEFVIDRSIWNVGYSDWKGQLIKNDVLMALAIIALPAEAPAEEAGADAVADAERAAAVEDSGRF